MKNKTVVIRTTKTKEDPFTRISNKVIGIKSNLSFEEKGLLVTLLSLPKDWKIYKSKIWELSNMSNNKFNRIWNALKEKGHLKITAIKGKGQKFGY